MLMFTSNKTPVLLVFCCFFFARQVSELKRENAELKKQLSELKRQTAELKKPLSQRRVCLYAH